MTKIVIGILIYFAVGFISLEIIKLHDRRAKDYPNENSFPWLEDDRFVDTCIVIFAPISAGWLIFYYTYVLLANLISYIRIFYTTIIYLIISLFKGKDN
jgi:hypothetical protein